jgi:fucose 4-O-acetylase-like acetyltransferase
MEDAGELTKERYHWVDSAKAIGMYLVYFGHVVQEMSNKGIQYTFVMTKFVYSFHMPLFFIMAGFFFNGVSQTKPVEIRNLILKRILPVLFFGALTFPFWPLYMYGVFGVVKWEKIFKRLLSYSRGHPDLNTITWFLVCLFAVEVLSIYILNRKDRDVRNFLWGIVFLYFGLRMTAHFSATVESLGIGKNFWYIHEAMVGFGLYALGFGAFNLIKKITSLQYYYRIFLLSTFTTVLLLTFNINNPYDGFVVIMKNSEHGEGLLFLASAILGTLSVILLATFVPRIRALDFIGKNSLTFIATSGLFHHFVNPIVVKRLEGVISGYWIILASLLIAIVSLLSSFPLVWFLNKYVPQLTGKPLQPGPILPNLDKPIFPKSDRKNHRNNQP